MPSAVALITNLEYEGTDLQDFPRIFLEIVSGLPWHSPDVRGGDSTVPKRDGQIERARRPNRLNILLKGVMYGDGATRAEQESDLVTAKLELAALFSPVLTAGTLSCTLPDGQTATIEARTELIVWPEVPEAPTMTSVNIRLYAIDPPEWSLGGS